MYYYILNENKNLVPCDAKTWSDWFATGNNRVALNISHDPETQEDIRVSTVFMGLNHGFYDDSPPLVFETMIFGGENDQYQERTSSWAEAEATHFKACRIAGMKDT